MPETAVLPVLNAVAVAVGAIGMLVGKGGKKIWQGQAEVGAVLPYAVVTAWTEPALARYVTQRGRRQTGHINWWGATPAEAQRAFEAGCAALDGVLLNVTGFRLVRCRMGYLTDFKEPTATATARGPWAVVGELTTETIPA